MLDFDELKEKVSDFFHEKPVLARISCGIIILFLMGLIVIFIQSSPPKSKIKYAKTNVILDGPPEIPQGPDIEKDYYPYRTTKEAWSDEEIDQYFTPPDYKMLKDLEKANDKIVSEITGAAS